MAKQSKIVEQKKKFAFIYKTAVDLKATKNYNKKKKQVFSFMRSNTIFTDNHGLLLKEVYNKEGYNIKEFMGFQEPIPEINYITPLRIDPVKQKKGLNPIGACDFETMTIPASEIPDSGVKTVKNYELDLLQDELYQQRKHDEDEMMSVPDFTEISPSNLSLYKQLKSYEQKKNEKLEYKEDEEPLSGSAKTLADAFKARVGDKKPKKDEELKGVNLNNLLEKKTQEQAAQIDESDLFEAGETKKKILRSDDQFDDINVITRIVAYGDGDNLTAEERKKDRFYQKKQINEGKSFREGAGQLVIAASFVFDKLKYSFIINEKIFKTKQMNVALILECSEMLMYTFWETLIKISEEFTKKNKKTEKIVFYFHNLGHFDGYFLVKFLLNNPLCQQNYQIKERLEIFNLNGKIIKIQYENIVILDSLLMVNMSLADLATTVLNEEKGDFNVEENDFNSMKKVFKTPAKLTEFINYNLKDSVLLYDAMRKVQDEVYKALRFDISEASTCPGLALDFFRKKHYFFPPIIYPKISYKKSDEDFMTRKVKSFKLSTTRNSVTLKTQKSAIFVTKPYYEKALRNAFYGGRTELFKPFGINVLILDINSQYPFAACSPLPFGSPVRVDFSEVVWDINDFKAFFGFIKIRFVSPPDEQLLPVLPRKHPEERNVYALGSGSGWYFCKEAVLAYDMGYKIEVLEAISFKPYSGFRKMIKVLYALRKQAKEENNACLVMMYKNLMNTGSYGRFALDFTKPIITIKNLEDNPIKTNKFIANNEIDSINVFKNKIALISHTEKPTISFKRRLVIKRMSYLIKSKNINLSFESKNETYQNSSYSLKIYKKNSQAIHISAAITSSARVNLYHFLNKLYKLGLLLYTDTDSLHAILSGLTFKIVEKILDVNFPLNLETLSLETLEELLELLKKIQSQPANLLGRLKVEDFCRAVRYVMAKLYAKEGSFKNSIKAKGIDKRTLNNSQEIDNLFEAIKEGSLTGDMSYTRQPVTRISKNKRTLEVMTKQSRAAQITNKTVSNFRTQIFNDKQEWVDTKSLILDENFTPISIEELTEIYKNFYTPFPMVRNSK